MKLDILYRTAAHPPQSSSNEGTIVGFVAIFVLLILLGTKAHIGPIGPAYLWLLLLLAVTAGRFIRIWTRRIRIILLRKPDGTITLRAFRKPHSIEIQAPFTISYWFGYHYQPMGAEKDIFGRRTYDVITNDRLYLRVTGINGDTICFVENLAPWKDVPPDVPYSTETISEDAVWLETENLEKLSKVLGKKRDVKT